MADIIPIANASWHDEDAPLFRFTFGAYGSVQVYAFGRLEAALEDAAVYLAEHAPGMFEKPDYVDAQCEAGHAFAGCERDHGDCPDCERVQERAEMDLTYTESGYLASWEWTCAEVDPRSREARLVTIRIAFAADLENGSDARCKIEDLMSECENARENLIERAIVGVSS